MCYEDFVIRYAVGINESDQCRQESVDCLLDHEIVNFNTYLSTFCWKILFYHSVLIKSNECGNGY